MLEETAKNSLEVARVLDKTRQRTRGKKKKLIVIMSGKGLLRALLLCEKRNFSSLIPLFSSQSPFSLKGKMLTDILLRLLLALQVNEQTLIMVERCS